MKKVIQHPPWLKVKFKVGENQRQVRNILNKNNLHTVCQEARCPNLSDCWQRGTATLMILGDACTRSCGFCAVRTNNLLPYDDQEPARVARAVQMMGLRHAVITSVTRDDLPDGGAALWAATIQAIGQLNPDCTIEVLIPDFNGDEDALTKVLAARPDLLAHNLETVPELYPHVRPQANYERSLVLLTRAKNSGHVTKTGIMVGLGETFDQVLGVIRDANRAGVDIFTIGQYLQPTKEHLPVARYVDPTEFLEYKRLGLKFGIRHVESAPLVRSSYHAEEAMQVMAREQ